MLFVEGEAEKVGSSGEFGRTETEKKNEFVDVVQQITWRNDGSHDWKDTATKTGNLIEMSVLSGPTKSSPIRKSAPDASFV